MKNTYLVAAVGRERDGIIRRLLALDPEAVIGREQNPCAFLIATKVSFLTIDAIDGVSHVFEISDEGKVVDTFAVILRMNQSRETAKRFGNTSAMVALDKAIEEELNRLRAAGKLSAKEKQ